jgi:hypothetical protein
MPIYHVTNHYNENNGDRTTEATTWISSNCPSLLEKVSTNNQRTSTNKFSDITDANKWIDYSLNIMVPPAASSAITLTE